MQFLNLGPASRARFHFPRLTKRRVFFGLVGIFMGLGVPLITYLLRLFVIYGGRFAPLDFFLYEVRVHDNVYLYMTIASCTILAVIGFYIGAARGWLSQQRETLQETHDFYKAKIEEEIIRARKLESVSLLAGGIAHDFNNVLTMVIGNLTLAKMSANRNKEISDRLAAAETAVLSAKRLTQQLLTFSKGGEPIKALTPTSEFIAEVAQLASISSQIPCEVSLPTSLPPVEIDQGMMTQVFTSVITNAFQAVGNEGKVKISGQVQTVGPQDNLPIQAGKYVEISVADNGIGIPEDRLSQIFDPYYTTKPDAAGLGLAIAHSVLIKHDGHIRVESEVGVGTSFIVYIPVSDKEIRPPRDEKERIESSGGRILVMDDEEMIQNMLRDVLIRFGYDVELAKDGTEAIALYKIAKQAERPFDCVIMDLTIPEGLGGRETIQKLLEMDPAVTAIVSSGYSNDPIMAAYKDYGFKGVVAKPYRVQDMLRTVREVLHTHKV